MEQIEKNQSALRKDMDTMGDQMNQLMETLHAVVQGQEELILSVTKLVDSASTSENGRQKNDGGIPKENCDRWIWNWLFFKLVREMSR